MNFKITITLIFILFNTLNIALGQLDNFEYRRSSLSMILIESDNFPNKESVMKSWTGYPFPDKYNSHKIDNSSINFDLNEFSEAELLLAGYLKDTIKGAIKILPIQKLNEEVGKLIGGTVIKPLKVIDENTAVVLPNEKQLYRLYIDKKIKEKKIANQMVAKWFNLSNGKFDMSLIQKRGYYNASEMEASIAKGQLRGVASLADAGEELLKNSFVTFTKLKFIKNEPAAAIIREATKIGIQSSNMNPLLKEGALKAADLLYDKTKEGYTLLSKTWLYQLDWNDSVATVFYTDIWNNPDKLKSTDLFTLSHVNTQYNSSIVTDNVLGKKKTFDELIDISVVRNLDNAFAKLQKENDVFKPKIPVLTSKPITAQIGKKEGLKGGEKFEVLERTVNPKTGLTEYKKIATATVDKKIIWDNRYNAGDEVEVVLDKDGNPITATPFKGSKKIQSGMLLKQLK